MANRVIVPDTLRINLSPHAFHIDASEHLRAYDGYPHSTTFSRLPYFLLARAIELELKSRLLDTMTQKKVKAKFGHDLQQLYEALPPDEKSLDDPATSDLRALSVLYKDKGLEYWNPELALQGYAQTRPVQIHPRRPASRTSSTGASGSSAQLPAILRIEGIARGLSENGLHWPELCGHDSSDPA